MIFAVDSMAAVGLIAKLVIVGTVTVLAILLKKPRLLLTTMVPDKLLSVKSELVIEPEPAARVKLLLTATTGPVVLPLRMTTTNSLDMDHLML